MYLDIENKLSGSRLSTVRGTVCRQINWPWHIMTVYLHLRNTLTYLLTDRKRQIIIIIIISLLKQLTNRSHKTQNTIQWNTEKNIYKRKQNVKLWCTHVNHSLNSQSGCQYRCQYRAIKNITTQFASGKNCWQAARALVALVSNHSSEWSPAFWSDCKLPSNFVSRRCCWLRGSQTAVGHIRTVVKV